MKSAHVPGYWMDETSGRLRPAVEVYLLHQPMSERHILAMRAYLRQWINGDFKGLMIDVLRTQVDEITTREDIARWLSRAIEEGIDPL